MNAVPLLAAILLAQSPDFDADALAKIKPRLEKFVAAGDVPGAVVVVGSSRGVAAVVPAGGLTLGGEPMADDTLFRVASMTKPVTALAVLMLSDEGKLKVSDPVEKYLPELRGQMLVKSRAKSGDLVLTRPSRAVTLKDLLTHTSGLPFYPPGVDDVYVKRNRTLAESILAVSQRPLEFEPGTRWAYCNSGIDMLGRVVEVVSGQGYEAFLAERVFAPLGMKDTTFHPTKDQRKRLAGLYGKKDGKLVLVADALLGEAAKARHPVPAGGLISTGPDMGKLYAAFLAKDKRLVKAETLKEMTAVQTGDLKCGFVPGMGFGYGFAVVKEPQGTTAKLSAGSFGHGGAWGTQSWADPTKDVFVILMIQRTGLPNADASEMRAEAQRLAVEARK